MPARHTLTVDLIDIAALDPRDVAVSVELENPRLVYPVGDPPGTVYPTKLEGRTDSRGVAEFDLLPSSAVGRYRVTVGAHVRVISMPENDIRLSAIPKEPA